MIEKVEIRTAQGGLLTLPLQDISEGFVVQDIDGLDPVDAVLVFSSFAGQDGSQFQSARRENRYLTLRIKYEPDPAVTTASKLRQKLYGYLMPKSVVQLRFYDDELPAPVNILGRVSKFNSPRFVKDPDATIELTCEIPDFDTLVTKTFGANSTSGTTETTRTYDGSVETGVLFRFEIDRNISGFTIYATDESNTQRSLVFTDLLEEDDVIEISTRPGNKYARRTRAGVTESVLHAVSPSSNWINLYPGTNKIRVLVPGAGIPWTMEYTDKYGAL
jgi:hypothetical protein